MKATTGPGTTAQYVLEGLRRAIVSGELRPGERVHQEDVAERMGVSIAPLREALATLEQEGQVTYQPRRGYAVTRLEISDLEEIYGLRRMLEEHVVRCALPAIDEDAMNRIDVAARACVDAAERGDVTAELDANRRFHFAIMEPCDQQHALRLVRMLWDSTEAYRAMYYNSPAERMMTVHAHAAILDAIRGSDADALVAELDAHRRRALDVLGRILAPAA